MSRRSRAAGLCSRWCRLRRRVRTPEFIEVIWHAELLAKFDQLFKFVGTVLLRATDLHRDRDGLAEGVVFSIFRASSTSLPQQMTPCFR